MTDHAEREREAREAYDNATVYAERMAMGEGVDRSMSADEAYAELKRVILASARERVEALTPTYRAFAGDDELLINRDAALRAITEAT